MRQSFTLAPEKSPQTNYQIKECFFSPADPYAVGDGGRGGWWGGALGKANIGVLCGGRGPRTGRRLLESDGCINHGSS